MVTKGNTGSLDYGPFGMKAEMFVQRVLDLPLLSSKEGKIIPVLTLKYIVSYIHTFLTKNQEVN